MIQQYNRPAVALHWLIALLILAALPLGLYMHDLPLSPTKLKLFSYHKWIGVTVLWLAVLRILWRFAQKAPAPLPAPRWQQLAAAATHGFLYLLLFAIPISGWLMSSAKGFTTVYFGVLSLPDLVAKDATLGETLTEVHEALNYFLMGLLALHIAGALKHHFIDHDATMRRMSFRRATS